MIRCELGMKYIQNTNEQIPKLYIAHKSREDLFMFIQIHIC